MTLEIKTFAIENEDWRLKHLQSKMKIELGSRYNEGAKVIQDKNSMNIQELMKHHENSKSSLLTITFNEEYICMQRIIEYPRSVPIEILNEMV